MSYSYSIASNYNSVPAENYPGPGKGNPQLPTTDCLCLGRPHGQDWHHRYPNISGLIHTPYTPPMSEFCFQQTLATFAPQQNGLQPPSMSAVPPHFQAHSSRSGTPQFVTPPPTGYPIGAPRTGPGGYPPSYVGGTGATSVPGGPYSAPPPPQTTNQTISAALAAIPENQRVSSQFDV
jgi:hypothetical protein